jgi:hypothetical protein
MSEQAPGIPVQFAVNTPPELEAGAYANTLAVWHTAYEFTLDFAAMQPPVQDEDGTTTVPCLVTARVKIPVTVMFDVLRALNQNMTQYEGVFGEIQRPEPRQAGGQ